MKKKVLKILKIALLIVFLASTGAAGWQWWNYHGGARDYREAVQYAGVSGQTIPLPERTQESPTQEPSTEEPWVEEPAVKIPTDPYMLTLAETDLAALQEVNADVIGWIDIPGTEVSYPLLQGENNDYYLEHTWKKEWNTVGSICLDYQVSPDFDEFNTIVYGHRMKNTSMFGCLKYYEDIEYWEERPSVYVVDEGCVRRYAIYAAFEPKVKEIIFGLGIEDQEMKEEFIRLGLEKSVIETGIEPKTTDRILTLSTCTGKGYSTRWVVQAVLMEEYFFSMQ